MSNNNIHSSKILPLVLSGGSGKRLWPLSRVSYPKQFLKLINNKSLIQNTIERIWPFKEFYEPLILCGQEHRFIVAEQLRYINCSKSKIVLEPMSLNTCFPVAIACLISINEYNSSNILMLPSDHYIKDEVLFRNKIINSSKFLDKYPIITFGIEPFEPNTGYGYIEKSNQGLDINDSYFLINNFIEKPSIDIAKKIYDNKNFLWNSGILLFDPNIMLEKISIHANDIYTLAKDSLKNSNKEYDYLWLNHNSQIKPSNQSIDKKVLEKIDNLIVTDFATDWSDVGSWKNLWSINKKDNNNNIIIGDVITKDTKNSLIISNNRFVTTLGLDNIAVVETGDSILIAKLDKTKNLSEILIEIEKRKNNELNSSLRDFRPWGYFDRLHADKQYQVKKLCVYPKKRLSLQSHKYRVEYWVVVDGEATVFLDGEIIKLSIAESIYVPKGSKHRLENNTNKELQVIEVQSGEYLGEDDIKRYTDDFGRIK